MKERIALFVIIVGLTVGELSGHEKYVKDYILACWREALALYKMKKTYLTIPSKYYSAVLAKQSNVMEEDPVAGLIIEYLDKKNVGDKVCSVGIFTEVINGIRKKFDRKQAKDIGRILNNLPDWQKHDEDRWRFKDYGPQRYWEKIDPSEVEKKSDSFIELNPIENKERFSDLD